MVSKMQNSSIITTTVEELQNDVERISQEQLQHLVRLVDQSDIVELEVTQSSAKGRLVLRKGRGTTSVSTGSSPLKEEVASSEVEQRRTTINAPCVGFFQPWSKAKNKPFVAVGDTVKSGQQVAVIRSLGVANEVESPMNGRITEILVQDGQAIEYGQPLMVIEH